MSWNDFNNAEAQQDFDLIPKGTIAKVIMHIRPGGYDDPSNHWTGGYATQSDKTGAVYLDCEFTILEGKYAKRKVWSLIGLHSSKGPKWGEMGRAFIKGILHSVHGISEKDQSPEAKKKRQIEGLGSLDGMEFLAKIGTKKDDNGDLRNEISAAVTPDHKEYKSYSAGADTASNTASDNTSNAGFSNKPSWAQ